MGVFSRLFKKEKEEVRSVTKEHQKTRIDALVPWLKDSNSVKIDHLMYELENLWDQVNSESSRLREAIKSLEKTEFEKNDKTYAAVNMTKDMFAKKARLLDKIPKAMGKDTASMSSAYSSAIQIIDEIKEANSKQAYIISNYFKQEADAIVKSMKSMSYLLSSFNAKISSEGGLLIVIERVSKIAEEYVKMNLDIEEKELEIDSLKRETEKKGLSIDSCGAEIKKIMEDKKWEELESARKELEEKKSEIEKMIASFNEDISSIRKPVKKILHDSKDIQLSKEQRAMLSSDMKIEDAETAISILKVADQLLVADTGLKGSELSKINAIKKRLLSGELDELKSQYGSKMIEMRQKEKDVQRLADIEKIKSRKKDQVNLLEEEMKNMVSEKLNLEKSVDELRGRKEKAISEIKSLILEKLNIAIEITD